MTSLTWLIYDFKNNTGEETGSGALITTQLFIVYLNLMDFWYQLQNILKFPLILREEY